jgi:hypothetical protein
MLIYFSKEAYLLSASLRRYLRTKTRIGVLLCLFSGVFLEHWRQFLGLNEITVLFLVHWGRSTPANFLMAQISSVGL